MAGREVLQRQRDGCKQRHAQPENTHHAEQAVAAQDIPVVQGIVVLAAAIFVIANLGVDVLQARIDPRLLSGGAR